MSSTLQKMVDAIELIGDRAAGVTVTELSHELQTSPASSSRLLSSLVESGLVSRNEDTQRHVLHPRLWSWGVRATRDARRLYAVAGPIMADAARAAEARFVFSVIHTRSTVLFAGVTPISGIVTALPMEHIIPLHACAPGKAMLAHQHAAFVDDYLRSDIERFTDATIAGPQDLERELESIRQCGYATNRAEYVANRSAIAVPVFDWRGDAIAAVSAGGKDTDEEFEQLERLLPALKQLADSISSILGHSPGA